MQGAGEAGRACADDQDVGFELFALDGHSLCHLSKALLFLAELVEFVQRYAQLPENLIEQRRSDFFSTVDRYGRNSPIRMIPSSVTSLLSFEYESKDAGDTLKLACRGTRH